MAQRHHKLTERLQGFIARQKIFFVGTAACDGRVNVSPKGLDTLRVLSPTRVIWLSLTGSGNETAAHLLDSDRVTLMFCAFDGDPLILRLYGHARAIYPEDEAWTSYIDLFPPLIGPRQIFEMTIDLVQTSCGFAVPLFNFVGERDLLLQWAEARGEDGLAAYRSEHNTVSLDGKPTR